MTIFRFRIDSPMIPRPLRNSATEEIDNTANRADQRSVRHVRSCPKQCNIPSLERTEEKTHKIEKKLCNAKLDYTSRLMDVNTCAIDDVVAVALSHIMLCFSLLGLEVDLEIGPLPNFAWFQNANKTSAQQRAMRSKCHRWVYSVLRELAVFIKPLQQASIQLSPLSAGQFFWSSGWFHKSLVFRCALRFYRIVFQTCSFN